LGLFQQGFAAIQLRTTLIALKGWGMTDTPPSGDRIAKVLSRAGIASRREAERMI